MNYKICKVYDSEAQVVLNGLRIARVNMNDLKFQSLLNEENALHSNLKELAISDVFMCSYCNVSFDNVTEQRNHYKLEWHRHNLKRVLNGYKSVSEKDFQSLEDDNSSMSSSNLELSSEESDIEDDKPEKVSEENNYSHKLRTIRHTKVFFENGENQILSIYRCLLHKKKETPVNEELVNTACNLIKNSKIWLIVMLGGGHFAAAIFNNGEITHKKTFHCYTVRAKQGGSQSTRDNKGGNHPKSAGASLRRYNEQALIQHVQQIISGWAEALRQCDLILYRAAGPSNGSTLFGGKNPPLCKTDHRLRGIPFPTRRASFKEVKRVYDILASIEIYGSADDFKNKFPRSPDKRNSRDKSKTSTEKGEKKDEDDGKEVENSPERKKKNSKGQRSKVKKTKNKDLREEEMISESKKSESSSSGGEETVDLTWNECEIGFDHLKEYEDTVPQYAKDDRNNQSRSKKKRKKYKNRRKGKLTTSPKDELFFQIQSRLFDCCQNGDKANLEEILKAYSDLPERRRNKNERKKKSTDDKFSREDFVDCLNAEVEEESENTLLHMAAIECLPEFVVLLLEAGADPTIRNKEMLTSYESAGNEETKNSFRQFADSFPDKFDWKKAGILSSLNEENKEEERKSKEEKKKNREETESEKAEREEKEKFLALSDREKRALAAERRLLSSMTANVKSSKPPVLSRCFQCGLDITGKIPFEYGINRFCSISCLKTHRAKTNSYGVNI